MGRLTGVLPEMDECKFYEMLRDNGIETTKVQGCYAFDIFTNFAAARLDDLQRVTECAAKRTTHTPATNVRPKARAPNANGVAIAEDCPDDQEN